MALKKTKWYKLQLHEYCVWQSGTLGLSCTPKKLLYKEQRLRFGCINSIILHCLSGKHCCLIYSIQDDENHYGSVVQARTCSGSFNVLKKKRGGGGGEEALSPIERRGFSAHETE